MSNRARRPPEDEGGDATARPAAGSRNRPRRVDHSTVVAERERRSAIAAELGRHGGLKGGRARARKLSAKKRAAIARKAAEARWKKSRS